MHDGRGLLLIALTWICVVSQVKFGIFGTFIRHLRRNGMSKGNA